MEKLDKILSQKLQTAQLKGTYRELKYNSHLIDFCSNDYLGLSTEGKTTVQCNNILRDVSGMYSGSGGSRLISGHHSFIDELEGKIAFTHQSEASLVLNSGYNANMAVLSSIPQKNDVILYDELCHASIKDGMRLSFAERFAFKHNDLLDLQAKLAKGAAQFYVVIESVYSMDGDLAPLQEISKICTDAGAILIVDEAHSTGIMGKYGGGLTCALGLETQVPIRIHTYGKAMGSHGASVVGSAVLKKYLINFSRQFIYTTALPLHSYASIYAAYDYVAAHYLDLQDTLMKKIERFKTHAAQDSVIAFDSPIICTVLYDNTKAKAKANELQNCGFDVRAILSPTVPLGKERIRVCLHTFNRDSDIEKLAKLIT